MTANNGADFRLPLPEQSAHSHGLRLCHHARHTVRAHTCAVLNPLCKWWWQQSTLLLCLSVCSLVQLLAIRLEAHGQGERGIWGRMQKASSHEPPWPFSSLQTVNRKCSRRKHTGSAVLEKLISPAGMTTEVQHNAAGYGSGRTGDNKVLIVIL